VWSDHFLKITEMLTQIKLIYLDNGYKIGKNGNNLENKEKYNWNFQLFKLSNLLILGLILVNLKNKSLLGQLKLKIE